MPATQIGPKLMAVISSAIQAYLDEEAAIQIPKRSSRLNSWRLSARPDMARTWTGRS